jgi:hypothetical protein
VALRVAAQPECWQLLTPPVGMGPADPATVQSVTLAPGEQAVGLLPQDDTPSFDLLVLSADRQRLLRRHAAGGSTPVHTLAAQVARCTVDPVRQRVALLSHDRLLTVLHLDGSQPPWVVRSAEPAGNAAGNAAGGAAVGAAGGAA